MAPSAEIGEADLAAQTERMFEGGGAAGVAGYRKQLGNEATAGELSNAMMTDRVFRMPAIYLLEAQAQHDERVFAYRFDWQSPLMGGALGACHAVELGFVFGTYDKNGGENFFGKGEAADAVSDFTRAAWINFARAGSPAGGLVPDWPVYGESRATMIIGTDTRVESAPDEGTRQMWREGSVGAL